MTRASARVSVVFGCYWRSIVAGFRRYGGVRRRLFGLLIAPLLAVVVMGGYLAREVSDERTLAEQAARVAEIATHVAALDGALGHETQIAVSSVFDSPEIGPKSLSLAESITDRRVAELEALLDGHSANDAQLDQPFRDAVAAIRSGSAGRGDLALGWISPLQLVDRNRTLRSGLLDALVWRAAESSTASNSNELIALVSLIEARSAHLDERVVLDLVIRYERWAPGQHTAAVVAIASQQDDVARANTLGARAELNEGSSLKQLRSRVLSSSEPLVGYNQGFLRAVSTNWMEQLDSSVRDHSRRLTNTLERDRRDAVRTQNTTVAGVLLTIAVASAAAAVVAFRLVRRVQVVAAAASSLSFEETPFRQIDDGGSDEIAEMARSFDRMVKRIHAAAAQRAVEADVLEAIASDEPLEVIIAACGRLLPDGLDLEIDDDRVYVVGAADNRVPIADALAEGVSGDDQLGVSLAYMAQWRSSNLRTLRRRASHDSLTQILNRAAILRLLSEMCGQGEPALLYVDLDYFKRVNDTHGHDRGDQILRSVADQLVSIANAFGGTVGRLGGDEFLVLVPDRSAVDLERLGAAVVTGVRELPALASTGVAASVGIAPNLGNQNAAQLMHEADAAMYKAKAGGRSRVVVADAALRAEIDTLHETERRLAKALAGDEFSVALQPIWDISGTTVLALEALARWTDHHGTQHSPTSFFLAAERSGRAHEIDRAIFDRTCRQIRAWQQRGFAVPPVHVNVSAQSLNRGSFVASVLATLERTGVGFAAVVLEITESALVNDIDGASERLRQLGGLGIRIAVDDFGDGYSSLRYVSRLPIDILKIDRQFIDYVDLRHNNKAIVQAVIGLARSLGMTVVAEGVERPEEHHVLIELGCEQLQGFLFGRPAPATEIEALLSKNRERRGSTAMLDQGLVP